MKKQVKSMTRLLSSLSESELIEKFHTDTTLVDSPSDPASKSKVRFLSQASPDEILKHIHRGGSFVKVRPCDKASPSDTKSTFSEAELHVLHGDVRGRTIVILRTSVRMGSSFRRARIFLGRSVVKQLLLVPSVVLLSIQSNSHILITCTSMWLLVTVSRSGGTHTPSSLSIGRRGTTGLSASRISLQPASSQPF